MKKLTCLEGMSKEKIYKYRKTIIGLALTFFIIVTGCVMLYKSQTSKVEAERAYAAANFEEGISSVRVTGKRAVSQRVVLGNIDIPAIDVMMRDVDLSKDAKIKVSLRDEDNNETLQEWYLGEDDIISNLGSNRDKEKITRLVCPEVISLGEETELNIRVELKGASRKDFVEIGVTETTNQMGQFSYNGENAVIGMISGIEMEHSVNSNYFAVMMTIAFILLFVLLFYMLYWKKVGLDKVFIVMGMIFGIFYMTILTPYSAPDEARHIETTVYFSSRLMNVDAVDEDGNVLLRKEDNLLSANTRHPGTYTLSLLTQHLTDMVETDETVSAENEPLNAPVIGYIPQIIGITLARVLHLGQIPMLLLGRLFALVFYVLACAYAIKKIPFGKMMIFALAICPMAMQQATSFSYDVMTNATAILYIAYLIYVAADPNKKFVDKKDFIILGVVAAFLAPCKAVYVLICFMVLIIPSDRFKTKKQKWMFKGGVLLIAVLMVAAFNFLSVLKLTDVNRVATAVYGEHELYTMADILATPTDALYLIWNTLGQNLDTYFFQLFGSTLSWLDINVSRVIVAGFGVVALFGIFKNKETDYNLRVRDKIWGALLCIGIATSVFFALLLDWTPKGSWFISGVQGRYFLPLVPIIMLILRNNVVLVRQRIDRYLVYGVYLLQFVTLYQIIAFVVNR